MFTVSFVLFYKCVYIPSFFCPSIFSTLDMAESPIGDVPSGYIKGDAAKTSL